MKNKNTKGKRILFYLTNIVLAIIFLAPFYWTFINSLKPRSEVLKYPPTLFPENLTFNTYQRLFNAGGGVFSKYALNSTIVTIMSVVFVCIISTLAGYALSKLKFKGINLIFIALLAIMMVPFQALLVPLYNVISSFGLLDTRIALSLIFTTYYMPFGIFMMKNSFTAIPESLRESAILEGASELTVLIKIFLPVVWPGLLTTIIYVAMQAWNDFIISLIFTSSSSARTIQVGLMNFASQRFYQDWGMINAGSIINMIPILILFILLQQYFIKGMLAGAVN